MPHLAKGYTSYLPIGSNRSSGRRPHLGNTTLPASSSIHGEHRNDLDSNSKKHQGDLSWMPSVTGALLAPEMVLRRSLELVLLAWEMAQIRMRLPLARSWMWPPLVFWKPPHQPFFCVRPEGRPLQLRSASVSCLCFQWPKANCVHTHDPRSPGFHLSGHLQSLPRWATACRSFSCRCIRYTLPHWRRAS